MENNITFKEGDVVVLKSGGPKMTINKVLEDGHCICNWFFKQKYEINTFPSSSLKPYEDNGGWFISSI